MVTLLANFLLDCLLFPKDLLIVIRDTRVKIGGRPDRGLVAMESPVLCWLHHLRSDLSPTCAELTKSVKNVQNLQNRSKYSSKFGQMHAPQLFAVQYSELETY